MNQLTRRDFLRLCGTSSIGLAWTACSVTSASITTPVPTDTMTATVTPTTSQTPTALPTPAPAITTLTWASDDKGMVKPEVMYPIVGALNNEHRKAIDVSCDNILLAIVTDQDLTKLSADYQRNLRIQLADRLNQDQGFQKILTVVVDALSQPDVIGTKFIVIVEDGKPTQLLAQQTSFVRYSIDANGTVAKMEKRYQLLAPLGVKEKDIVRRDTEEVVRLKGFELHGPVHNDSQIALTDPRGTHAMMQTAKLWGANFVTMDVQMSFVRDPNRVNDFTALCQAAENFGMYFMFEPATLRGNFNTDIAVPNDEFIDLTVELADILKPFNNAMLSIFCEPKTIATDQMVYDSISKSHRRLRTSGYERIIFVPGTSWSLSFDYLKGRFLRLEDGTEDLNLVYKCDFDAPYDPATGALSDGKIRELFEQTKPVLDVVLDKKPILFGEFTFGHDEQRRSPFEPTWQETVLKELINPHGLSYAQMELSPYADKNQPGDNPLSLLSAKGTPTPGTGKFALTQRAYPTLEDLKADPPPQFDK